MTSSVGSSESSPSFEEFRKVVESRRSVRVFDGTPIPPEIVRACIDLALLAPNSSNLQPWEFLWVRSPERRAKVVEACFSQPAAATAAELIVCVARTGTWKRHAKEMLRLLTLPESKAPASAINNYAKLVPFVYTQGPFGVLGWLKRLFYFGAGFFRLVPREPIGGAGMRLWAVKSTALACENLMLAFRAAGYDSCPMEGYDSSRLRRVLELPCDAEIAMVVSAGKRAPAGIYGPRVRFDRDWFVREI